MPSSVVGGCVGLRLWVCVGLRLRARGSSSSVGACVFFVCGCVFLCLWFVWSAFGLRLWVRASSIGIRLVCVWSELSLSLNFVGSFVGLLLVFIEKIAIAVPSVIWKIAHLLHDRVAELALHVVIVRLVISCPNTDNIFASQPLRMDEWQREILRAVSR